MSSVVKAVKKGFSSAAGKVRGALKGDLGDLASVVTLGASDLATQPIEWAGSKAKDAILPDMPDVNIPEQPVAGATPGTVGRGQANVDIGATEQQRRTSGSAKGSRKLRVPLGGLR